MARDAAAAAHICCFHLDWHSPFFDRRHGMRRTAELIVVPRHRADGEHGGAREEDVVAPYRRGLGRALRGGIALRDPIGQLSHPAHIARDSQSLHSCAVYSHWTHYRRAGCARPTVAVLVAGRMARDARRPDRISMLCELCRHRRGVWPIWRRSRGEGGVAGEIRGGSVNDLLCLQVRSSPQVARAR